MPVIRLHQSMETSIGSRPDLRGGSTIPGSNARGDEIAGDAAGADGGDATELGGGGPGTETASDSGLESVDMAWATGEDGGAAGMVTVSRCISNGIASEATSTTVHAVICACGLRTRSSVKPSQTTPPSASDRSADSTSSAIIATSL